MLLCPEAQSLGLQHQTRGSGASLAVYVCLCGHVVHKNQQVLICDQLLKAQEGQIHCTELQPIDVPALVVTRPCALYHLQLDVCSPTGEAGICHQHPALRLVEQQPLGYGWGPLPGEGDLVTLGGTWTLVGELPLPAF